MTSVFSLLDIINKVKPDPQISFEWPICCFTAVKPNGTYRLLAGGVTQFYINGRPTVINGPRKSSNSLC